MPWVACGGPETPARAPTTPWEGQEGTHSCWKRTIWPLTLNIRPGCWGTELRNGHRSLPQRGLSLLCAASRALVEEVAVTGLWCHVGFPSYIKKQRHYFVNKGPSGQGYGFNSSHVWMWELDYKESWAPKNWCFWTVLEKTLESTLDWKEIQPVHPKGDQSWVFIGRIDVEAEAPIFWPPDAKSWLIWKDPDAGKDWGQEEKGMTEDEMVGWHRWLNGHGFGWTPGVGDGQGGWCAVVHGVAKSRTWLSNWTELMRWCVMCLNGVCKVPDT